MLCRHKLKFRVTIDNVSLVDRTLCRDSRRKNRGASPADLSQLMGKHASNEESDDDEMHFELLPVISDLSKAVSVPDENDVICGRGKSVAHLGNQRFRKMVSARKEAYQKATRRDEKTFIASEIVEALRQGPEPSRYVNL